MPLQKETPYIIHKPYRPDRFWVNPQKSTSPIKQNCTSPSRSNPKKCGLDKKNWSYSFPFSRTIFLQKHRGRPLGLGVCRAVAGAKKMAVQRLLHDYMKTMQWQNGNNTYSDSQSLTGCHKHTDTQTHRVTSRVQYYTERRVESNRVRQRVSF